MGNAQKSRALAFKEKYSPITNLAPEEVGKAVIMEMVYTRLTEPGEQLPGLFTIEERDVLVSKLATDRLWRRYTTYRQLASWLKQQWRESTLEYALNETNKAVVAGRLQAIQCTAVAEMELRQMSGSSDTQRTLTQLMTNAGWEGLIAAGRDSIAAGTEIITRNNAIVDLVAKEIKIPELVEAYTCDMSNQSETMLGLNPPIAGLRSDIYKYFGDDGSIETAIRKAIDAFEPYVIAAKTIPKERLAAARKQIKGLKAFEDPLTWEWLNDTLRGIEPQ